MKKYFKFLSLVTIMAIVASISVLVPVSVKAGSLTNVQISLSSYDVSNPDPIYVDLVANVTLSTALNAGDKVKITFQEYEGFQNSQFWIDTTALTSADVSLICDPEGAATGLTVDSETDDSPTFGSGSPYITITTGGSEVICAADAVLQIQVASATTELRNPTTVDDEDPNGYRIRIDTLTSADSIVDTGIAAVFLNSLGANQVYITGTVDPVLTMALNTNSCDLGVLTKDAFRSCHYDITVGTNAPGGYNGSIKSDGDLKYGTSVIQQEADGVAPTYGNNGYIDNIALLSESEYGIGVVTTDTTDVYPSYSTVYGGDCDAVKNPANLDYSFPVASLDSATAQRFAYSATPVDASTTGKTTICHVARISGTQAPGAYTQAVTITVVGNF